jgi:stage V sporulation protein R
MGRTWSARDLEYWDGRIREKAEEFGLDFFPQEFQICDHEQMLGYMAYHGLPAHYPHWSFGKSYEKLKTLYHYGVSGLPYEMVINSNPSLAYLMRDNSLCLQILTIAHVYAHNDFFKNNFMFQDTHPELTLSNFKLRADRVRGYMEDPSIGPERCEHILDAAHALSLQCRRHRAIRKLSPEEQRERAWIDAQPPRDPNADIHTPREYKAPDLKRVPLEPEEDLLLFIAEHNSYLAGWERDLLHIVHEESQYFIPQIETKIMNEGWASFWHHRIMNSLELPEDLQLEFLVHHNQVVRPHPGGINPYHVGFTLWHEILRRYEESGDADIEQYGTLEQGGMSKIFEIRETDRDVAFLRRFLTEALMREMDFFEHRPEGDKRVVSHVSDEDSWEIVKHTLLRNTGMEAVPVIRITDADHQHRRILYLTHEHDGRDLEQEHLQRTLAYVYRLWGRPVLLETQLRGKKTVCSYDKNGFNEARD